ncbi:hypothetical protein H4W01_003727 [Sphingomonas sp. PL20]
MQRARCADNLHAQSVRSTDLRYTCDAARHADSMLAGPASASLGWHRDGRSTAALGTARTAFVHRPLER